MIVRKLRLQRGWSQEQLSQLTGLSVRTIQRIERGQNAGLESLNSLAAVFEVELIELQQENDMTTKSEFSNEEQYVIEHVQDIKAFYSHLMSFVLAMTVLFIINWVVSPGYIWAWWAALGWGIGIISHGMSVFEIWNFFGPKWEKRQIEKRLGRKL